MTIIVGVCDGRSVWMGADSFAGNGEYVLTGKLPKVWQAAVVEAETAVQRPILAGSSGDYRAGYLVRLTPLPEDETEDAYAYIAGPFVDALRKRFQEAGWQKLSDGRDGDNDVHVLVGYRGRLFSIWEDFQAVETVHDYMAIGAAMTVALGSLHSTGGIDSRTRIDMALKAAETHNAYVRRPFVRIGIGSGAEAR